ncbi:MAG: hypothetical protein J4431_04385 [Candidatus Aenigmarchaeota archaeon]|nr:hypothetical protein [Candidatus Aenigmarchaeota archaeon]
MTELKGQGGMIQSLFMTIMVVGFSVILVVFILTSTGRQIFMAQEEAKLYTVNNAYWAANRSLDTFWKIAAPESVFLLAKESSGWDWKSGITKEFAQERLSQNARSLLPDRSLDINRIVLNLNGIDPEFEILDNRVNLRAKGKIGINFFESSARASFLREYSVAVLLPLMIEKGNAIERTITETVTARQYSTSDMSSIAYEDDVRNRIISAVARLSGGNVDANVESISTSIEASEGKKGIDLRYAVDSVATDKSSLNRHFDDTRFVEAHFTLPVRSAGAATALNCASRAGRYNIARFGDTVCSGGQIFTCGTPLTGIGENTVSGGVYGNYACTGSYFCDRPEKEGSQTCCQAFGGTWAEIEICANPECTATRIGYECQGGA